MCGDQMVCTFFWSVHHKLDQLLHFRSKNSFWMPIFSVACEEAKEIHQNRKKVLEAKEAARQNSKFYTKIKVFVFTSCGSVSKLSKWLSHSVVIIQSKSGLH